jgi:hypothetical protein
MWEEYGRIIVEDKQYRICYESVMINFSTESLGVGGIHVPGFKLNNFYSKMSGMTVRYVQLKYWG